MIRFLVKEASLLIAFVVLGGLLLVSLWITTNVHRSVLREFQNTQISVVLKDDAEKKFRNLVEDNSNVIRYEIFSAFRNKERLGSIYPDLKNVIQPLDEKFFPISAVVTVKDGEAFLKYLKAEPQIFESQILHKPPTEISNFISVLTATFGALWLLTLTLVLYFNLERITMKEEAKWSLMKMLGAKPTRLFAPLWMGQSIRIGIASISAILLAILVSSQIEDFFIWTWSSLPLMAWIGFFLISLGITSGISFGLFYSKFRRVAIG